MYTTHFRTYLSVELSDLVEVLGQVFDVANFHRDYENKWEWIEGSSRSLSGTINVSREHNWTSGIYEKPLNITISTQQALPQTIIDSIGNQLHRQLHSDVYLGNVADVPESKDGFIVHKKYSDG